MKKILLALILGIFISCTNTTEDLYEAKGAVTANYLLGTRLHHTSPGLTITAAEMYLKLPRMPIGPSQQSNFVQGFIVGNFSDNMQNVVEFTVTRSAGHLQHIGNLWIWVGGDHYDVLVKATTGPAGSTTAYPPTTLGITAYPGDHVGLIYNAEVDWLAGNTPRLEIIRDGASGFDGYLDTQTAFSVTPGTNPINVAYDPYAIFTVNTATNFGCFHDMPPADDDVNHIGSYDIQAWYYTHGAATLTFMPFGSPTSSGCGLQAFQIANGTDTVQWYNP